MTGLIINSVYGQRPRHLSWSRKECLSRGNVALVTVMATVLPGSVAEMVRATFTNVVYVLRVVVDAIVYVLLDPS